MLKGIITLSYILSFNFILLGQYNFETFDKTSNGIEKSKTITGVHFLSLEYVNHDYLNERTRKQSFIERDGVLYYSQNNQHYELAKLEKINKGHYSIEYDKPKITTKDTSINFLNSLGLPINAKQAKYIFDNMNNLWIVSRNTGVYYIKKNDTTHYSIENGLPTNNVNDLIQDIENNIWIATKKGICKFNNGQWINYTRTNSNKKIKNVAKLEPLKNGGFVFRTNKSVIGVFDGNEMKYLPVPGMYTMSMNRDKFGYIWITLREYKGIIGVFSRDEIYLYDKTNGYNNERIVKTFQDFQDNIWIITASYIGRLSEDKKRIHTYPIEATIIHTVFQESQNRIWFLGDSGCAYFDFKQDTFVDFNQLYGIRTNYLPMLLLGHPITAYNNSDFIFDEKENFIYTQYSIIKENSNVGKTAATTLEEYSLILLINQDEIINLSEQLPNSDNRPLNIYLDSDGYFWIDTPTQIHKLLIQ